jgi:hypothetical protein
LRIKDPRTLPYGCFQAGKFSVLFDRRYRPIVRLPGRWPDCDLSRAVRCDPDWWIEHESETTFYTDRAAPTRDKKTRARLMALVRSIPGLALETARRNLKKAKAVYA